MQLKMNFSVDTLVPSDDKVRLVCNIVDRMDLDSILSTISRLGRKPAVDPVTMFKILVFCYSEGLVSSRNIEKFCKYDNRAHFILQGFSYPDHSTINRFRNILEEHIEGLLEQFVSILYEDKHVDLKSIYIDGTKIESFAGRYTFVWKKSILKNQEKLKEKMRTFLNLDDSSTLEDIEKEVEHRLNLIRNTCKKNHIVFVHGCGKRKTEEQKQYEHLEEASGRFSKYKRHLLIMDQRNSYSKTDHDATFMRMKDDHMRNGQLKPAYNIQVASNGAFIVGVMGSQKANDLHTFVPFMDKLQKSYKGKIENVVADSGYESEENYEYLSARGITSYIKPSNYEIKKTKKYKTNIGRKENMKYDPNEDVYICASGKKLNRLKDRRSITGSGYKITVKRYGCFDCKDCEKKDICIKSRREDGGTAKFLSFSEEFEKFRKQSEENIMSEIGIDERLNRSIQAEGVFSKLKDGLSYDRFRHRGLKKVVSDMQLMAIGMNINKLHKKIQKVQTWVIRYKKAA